MSRPSTAARWAWRSSAWAAGGSGAATRSTPPWASPAWRASERGSRRAIPLPPPCPRRPHRPRRPAVRSSPPRHRRAARAAPPRPREDRLMPRAFLVVMDSVGCGGAPDAGHSSTTASPTPAPTRSPISPRPAPPAGPRTAAAGPSACRTSTRSASAPRSARLGRRYAGPRRRPCGPLGRRDRGVARQGHALGPLGTGGRARALGLAHLPQDRRCPAFPPGPHGRGLPPRRHRRHPRQPPRLGHGDHRRGRRGPSADRLADLLHLGRQRLPDRRARGGFRARPAAALCEALRPDAPCDARGPRDRPPLHRRAGRLPAHRQPPRLRHRAARAHAAATGCAGAGRPVHAVGKIGDIFSMQGITDVCTRGRTPT
jgi:phosphopentomutase